MQKIDFIIKKFSLHESFSFSKYAPIEATQVAKSMVHHALNFDKVSPGIVLEGDNLKFEEYQKNESKLT